MKIVILGASGDLAKRKLFPNLAQVDLNTARIVAYARSDIKDTFHDRISEYGIYNNEFLKKIEYIQGTYENIDLDINDTYIFYFSVPPSIYLPLLDNLNKFKNCKIAIEKPFATDLESYKQIVKHCGVFLVDHYLLKPIVNCMSRIRSKIVLEHYYAIDFIMKEELGIEGRVYFDATGIVKDMLQNHMMVLYSSLLSDDRVSVLKQSYVTEFVLGQYNGYVEELGRPSETETYAALFMKQKNNDNKIFTFQVGKGLDEKRTQIRIKYIKEFYKQVIEKTLGSCVEYQHTDLDSINSLELVIDVAKNCVYLEVVTERIMTFTIFDKTSIKSMSTELTGELDDHALVFDCLINNKDFSSTSIEEGMLQWELFEDVKHKLIHYNKGVAMPNEASELFERIDNEYKK